MAKFDLHLHSNNSDGSDSVQELLRKIIESNIEIFALTDHDTVSGIDSMLKIVPKNIKFIKGIELTCKAENVKCHILGYNINHKDKTLTQLIEKGKSLRKQKLETRINYLKNNWDIELTQEELDWLYSRQSVVKTHLANVLVKRKLADNNLQAMAKYLDDCKTGNTRFDGVEGIKAIIKAGGIPVWAHPLGGEGETHDTKNDFIQKLKTMIQCGIKGLECYYSRYSLEEITFLKQCANDYNLLITGGSDYHGTNKTVTIGRLNTTGITIDSDNITILSHL